MQKLYDIVFTDKKDRELLYYKVRGEAKLLSDGLFLVKGTTIDFLTYFNCFSLVKWKEYTTLQLFEVCGEVTGKCEVEIYSIGKNGQKLASLKIENAFRQSFNIEKLKGEILGLRLKVAEDCMLKNLHYKGEFVDWRDLKIGVSICTFKREEYVKDTMAKLLEFSKKNPWLSTLVIDNGSTLEKCETSNLRIIHNPNYGGSGGFTRGLLENLQSKTNDYVLLMDDDIDLEPSALEHMYGLLCGLKEEYKESFLSGAMLRMQTPCIQHENTAYWGKIRLHSLGKGWNLTNQQVLLDNEHIADCDNQYGAWWYCCIPLKRVEQIGLPLPVFVKGDDIEYGLRNERKVIHMNGIGVWHEAFEGKQALWVNYFAYRNFFIMNQYAKGCSRWTLLAMTLGRMAVHFLKAHYDETKVLKLSIKDALEGFEGITSLPADKKLELVRSYKGEGSYFLSVLSIVSMIIKCWCSYNKLNQQYKDFRSNSLKDSKFWIRYLNL